jgi:hypothetical protein
VHVVEAKSSCPTGRHVVGSEAYGSSPPLPPEMWEHPPPGAQELIVVQAAALAQRRVEVAQLKATGEALARRVGRNARHAAQPPAADPPHALRRSRRESSGRRPGGQPGHAGPPRTWRPGEEVDVVIPVPPVRCLRWQPPVQGLSGVGC